MNVERMTLRTLSVVLAGLMTESGCFPEDELEVRKGNVLDAPDPIPGGGPCKGCIRGFRQVGSTLELCVDTTVKYVTDVTHDGTSLLTLLTSQASTPKWTLVTDLESGADNACYRGACRATTDTRTNKKYVTAILPIDREWTAPEELYLVLEANDGRPHGGDLKQMPRILLENVGTSPWPCDPGYKAPVSKPAYLTKSPPPFVAQIAYPWARGGVRSCSGVFVSPRHILTAAHCFDYGGPDAVVDFYSSIDVRLGVQPWPVGGSVVDVILHEDYHLGELEADLAIVELASDVEPAIEPAQLPGLQPHVPTGDFWAYGYGVRPYFETTGFDWGMPKVVKMLWSALPLAGAEHLTRHLHFMHLWTSPHLCQGDSGGPVLTEIDGTPTLVAILVARVGSDASRLGYDVEPMGGALAFNHGHTCGSLDLTDGYVATPFDPETLAWIYAHIGLGGPPIE